MRLPYLQVAQEAWARARDLGGLAGIHRQQAMGLLVDLWAWALTLGPDDKAPTGQVSGEHACVRIANAVDWHGDASVLMVALVEIGLVEALEPGPGMRVKGMSRYANALTKAQERSAKAKQSAEIRWSMRTQSERNAVAMRNDATQTQTQTQTQVEATAARIRAKKPRDASADGRRRELSDRLCAAFETTRGAKYGFDGAKDARALAKLEAFTPDDAEIERRWRIGLNASGYQRCDSFAQLALKWNGATPNGIEKPRDIRRGTVRAEDQAKLYGDEGEKF